MKEALYRVKAWIDRAEDDQYCDRNKLLLKAVGIEDSAQCLFQQSYGSAGFRANRRLGIEKPLPDRLVVAILNIARARYEADRSKMNGLPAAYSLPWWLAWKPKQLKNEHPSFRVTIGERRDLTIRHAVTGDELEPEQLKHVMLRQLRPSKNRRKFLSSSAEILSCLLEEVVAQSALALDRDWLKRARENPIDVEAKALEIWNKFIVDCALPSSFSNSGRALSLADLMKLKAGPEGGSHRYSFAEQQPWAARALLRESHADEMLAQIDENPANAIPVAAQFLCCRGDVNETGCSKAADFARALARHRENPLIDKLLGSNDREGRQIRSLLMEAHKHDKELFTHIGTDVLNTRRLIKSTIQMIFDYQSMGGSTGCAYELGALMVRMMVRNQMDARCLDREALLRGLVTMSADCLAAFALERLSNSSILFPEPDADSLDSGLLAFVAFLGRTQKPQMTSAQLLKLAKAANERGVRSQSVFSDEDHPSTNWSVSSSWPNVDFSDPRGEMKVVPLASIEDIHEEGRSMSNCLANGRYNRAAVFGGLAFFSISGNGDRATLSIKPFQQKGRDGKTSVEKWEIDELCGFGNGKPSDACKAMAELVVQRMNEQCPHLIPDSEINRRMKIRMEMDRHRGVNADIASAQRHWDEIYLKFLPRRFASLSPSEIIDSYLASG